MPMKNVLIIHTGGTFGMTPIDPDKTLEPGNIERSLDQYVPNIHKIADISIEIPFNLDSSNIGPAEWCIVYQIIQENMEKYDGFVIIHGTDSLVYTASALSYLLLDLKKPVIITGSQRPLSALRTDARGNLVNAIELCTYDIPEVTICFGNKLFRGNRTKKDSIESFQSFDSPNYPLLASIGLNITLHSHYLLQQKELIDFKARFDSEISTIKIFPGLDLKLFKSLIESGIRAVILEGLGAGNLPALDSAWIDFISELRAQNILLFMSSQSPHGAVDLDLYSCGRQAKAAGAISLRDMTIEAALVKLMLLTGNFEDQVRVAELMQVSLAGEISL
jgi:L-asparaginase